jgi:hypothetical protein
MSRIAREHGGAALTSGRLDELVGLGAGLRAAIDDVAWAAGGLAGELDAMIARREAGGSAPDAATQVAAAARLLPRRR